MLEIYEEYSLFPKKANQLISMVENFLDIKKLCGNIKGTNKHHWISERVSIYTVMQMIKIYTYYTVLLVKYLYIQIINIETYTWIVWSCDRIYPRIDKYNGIFTFTMNSLWESKEYTQIQLHKVIYVISSLHKWNN